MIAIAFIGTIQHDVSKDAIRKLISTIKSETSCDTLIVCNADGLFSVSSKLGEQLELLFDSGIDLVFVGEQAICRNCCRSVLAKTQWPIVRSINLPGSTTEASVRLINLKDKAFWFIGTAGQKGKISVEYSYLKLDEFFQNKRDNLPVIIIESNVEYKYLQALAWRYSKFNTLLFMLGSGTGLSTSFTVPYDNCFLQCDIGSVVSENSINGIEPELWWRKNIERRPLTLLPKWGALLCDYTIVFIDEGKFYDFSKKSVRI